MTTIAKTDGASDHEIEGIVENLRQIISLIREEASETEIRFLIMTMLKNQCASISKKSKKETKEDDKAANAQIDCVLSMHTSPWFRFFIDYDPQPSLEQVKCPALFLFGELDTQVPEEVNRMAIWNALKQSSNNDYELKTIPKANHMFQSAITGSPSEYMSLEKEFVPGLLEFMSDWVIKRVDIVPQ